MVIDVSNGAEGTVPLWHIAWTFALSVVSGLAVIALSLFRWNWGKLCEDVQQIAEAVKLKADKADVDKAQASIEALYQEKADKDEVDKKHLENKADLHEIKAAIQRADGMRDEMWKVLGKMNENVAILLDRDDRDPK